MPAPKRIPAPAPPQHTPLYGWIARRMARWDREDGAGRSVSAVWSACVLLLGVCAVLLLGPVINAPTSLDDVLDSTREAAHDSWLARETSIDMSLERDAEGRLRAEVTENYTALFPDGVDATGIERVVLSELEGHDLAPTLVRATIDGKRVEPRTDDGATRTSWFLDAGERLRGDHEFSLTYTLDDAAYLDQDESSGREMQRLYWDAFGPEFEHGSAKSSFSLTMPQDLADALQAPPRGAVFWTIIGGSQLLEPERLDDGAVRFEVTNSQNLPPYAQLSIDAQFAPGTFEMPTPSVLFWIMLLGPFVPLMLAALLLTCSLAGRAVLWSDAPGEPWIIAQFRPPKNVTAAVAARVVGARRTVRLADLAARYQQDPSPENERRLAREARLAASPGLALARPSGYRTARAWREQFEQGLRRRASGVPKHVLLAFAVVLVAAQLALTRQLAEQENIGLEWWPILATALVSLLAAVACAVVLTAAPLSARGAKLRDFVEGIRLYDSSAHVGDMIGLRDPLLPYALMIRPPRQAAALATRVLDDAHIAPDRTPRGLPTLRAAVRVVPALAVAAAIVVVSVFPGPSSDAFGSATYEQDLPGRYGTSVQEFDARATVRATEDGPRVDVTETLQMTVVDAGRIPQVFRDWHDHVDGHDTQLTVTDVRVDGESVPYEQQRVAAPRTQTDHAMLRTRIASAWPGEHTVQIDYALASPVATVKTADGWQQRIRWSALAPGWDWDWDDYDAPLEHASASLVIDESIRDRMRGDATGWSIDRRDREDSEVDVVRSGGATELLFVSEGEYGTDTHHEDADAGIQLVFDEGEFDGAGTRGEWRAMKISESLPTWVQFVFAIPALVAGLLGVWRMPRRKLGREAVVLISIGFTLASIVTWFWGSVHAYGDEPWFVMPGILMLANIGLAISVVVVLRQKNKSAAARKG